MLDWLPAASGLVVEIKARAAADAVVDAVACHAVRADGRLSVISFDEAAIERVRERDPDIKTGYLLVPIQPIEPALVWATEHGHTGVLPWEGDLGLDPLPIIAKAQAFGREIGCYVINDPERMQHLAALGLWGFVTDVPRSRARGARPGLERLRAGGGEIAERLARAGRIVDTEGYRDPRALHAGRHDQRDVDPAVGEATRRRAERARLVLETRRKPPRRRGSRRRDPRARIAYRRRRW